MPIPRPDLSDAVRELHSLVRAHTQKHDRVRSRDPKGFRDAMIQAVLESIPRGTPGRKAAPVIAKAARLFAQSGRWHNAIFKECIPNYADLDDSQKAKERRRLQGRVRAFNFRQRRRMRKAKKRTNPVDDRCA